VDEEMERLADPFGYLVGEYENGTNKKRIERERKQKKPIVIGIRREYNIVVVNILFGVN